MRQYLVNEIFYSIQGEGAYAGHAMHFLRMSHCNLQCSVATHGFDCDTEFKSGVRMTADEIVNALKQNSVAGRRVCITGGEPLLQIDRSLLSRLTDAAMQVHIETNGTITLPDGCLGMLAHISCSPKAAEHALKLSVADELRYVRHYGQGIPQPSICLRTNTRNKFISPAFNTSGIIKADAEWCVKLIKENPEWILSLQTHKLLGCR